MSKLTGNNKDYLFKMSNFFKKIVLLEEVNVVILKKLINNFTDELVDDGVIDDDESVDKLRESLTNTFLIMIDNRKEGMYGKYFGENED